MSEPPNRLAPVAPTSPVAPVNLRATTESPLAGRVAVVTGASSGIGRAIALALARQEAIVCLVGRDGKRLAGTARTAETTSPRVLVERVDLARDNEVADLARRLQAEFAGLDVLVHGAGVFRFGSHVDAAGEEELDLLYRVNARAPYCLTRALLPLLRLNGGQIVFINSSAGLRAGPAHGLYAASKHALRALADSLRDEVNSDGIRVLSVYPGRVAGPIQRELFSHEGMPYDPALLLQPEDVAAMVTAALNLPRGAEVTDIIMRPARKSY